MRNKNQKDNNFIDYCIHKATVAGFYAEKCEKGFRLLNNDLSLTFVIEDCKIVDLKAEYDYIVVTEQPKSKADVELIGNSEKYDDIFKSVKDIEI